MSETNELVEARSSSEFSPGDSSEGSVVTLPFSQIPSPHKPTSVAAVPAISTGQKFSISQTSDITTILKRVNDFSYTISGSLKEAIREINQINMQSKILSFNAHIESAREGSRVVPLEWLLPR